MRAQVFISCGQNKSSGEVEIANKIAQVLTDLGIQPYVAVAEQTLRGLRESIFARLESSEYFLFVDFRRERLKGSRPRVCRGSLFSHQELALASYLDLDVIVLQEEGVKHDDGIIRFLQANAILFSDRRELPSLVLNHVKKRQWDANWKNALSLDVQPVPSQAIHAGNQIAMYYHIAVKNHHKRRMARNCFAYLTKVFNVTEGRFMPLRTVELKWAGYILPGAHIASATSRDFDAFWLPAHDRRTLQFNAFTDATDYIPQIGPGQAFQFTYSVASDNFHSATGTFEVHLADGLEDVQIRKCAPKKQIVET